MRRWAVLLVALLALGVAVPVVDAKPRPTPKQRCLKAAKQQRTKAKRKRARARCLRTYRHAAVPQAPAAAAPVPAPPAAGAQAPVAAPPAPADPGVPTLPDAPEDPHALQVISGEYFLKLSKHQVLAGDVRVEFNNAFAEDPHDLKLAHGDQVVGFDEQPAGQVQARTLQLAAGTWTLFWTLFCALPEHAQRGMRATLTVAD